MIVRFSGVAAKLGGKRILSGISFQINGGENWAVVGPNGSGKTTLLRIMNGYLRPTAGAVQVLGEKFGGADLRELRREVGFVSSYMGELISLDDKVLDVVVAGRNSSTRLWSVPPEEDVEEAIKTLKLLGCSRHEDSMLRDLSQGEKQKILIARALMTKPKLLTLDEPCAGLDLKARESFLSSLQKIAGKGMTSIVYVTHRIDEIPVCFTHALLLKGGNTIAQGLIDSVLNRKNLSTCFDVDVAVKKHNGRYFPMIGQL